MNAFSHPIEPGFGGRLRQVKLDEEPDTVEIDIRAIWATLWRNRTIIAGTALLAILVGVASILVTTPTYRAASSVQVDAQSAKVLDSDDLEPVVSGMETERFIRTQMDIVRSRSLATSVAQALNLRADTGFLPPSDASPANRERQAVGLLQHRLSVDMLPNSRVVRISIDDTDPARAARIANAFSDQLIKSNLQRKYSTSAYSRQFLSGQLTEAKRKLEDSERALIAYARDARLIDASAGASHENGDTGTKSLTTANLVELNDSYAAARAARIKAEERWNQAQGAPVMTLPEVLSNPTIQTLSEQRATLQAQFQEEREHHKPDYPAVLQLQAKITETSSQISTLAGNIRNSIRDEYKTAQKQEEGLSGDVSSLKQATLDEQDRSVQYNILKREVDTSRAMYDAMLQRYKEISAAAGIANNNITIVDHSDTPGSPVSPNPVIHIGVATLAGLLLALLIVFARERFMDRIRDPEELTRKLKLPLLGVVPAISKKISPLDAMSDPRSGFSEAHNSLCTALLFSSATGMPRSIMITSTRPAEGKSTTAMALAISLAREGRRVLLIDADLRRPSLHTTLGVSNSMGLVHLLTRNKAPEEVIWQTSIENLWFLPSGPVPPSPTALLAPGMLSSVLDELGRSFDTCVIDAPPVLGLADAPRLSSIVAATVFVHEAGGAHAHIAERSIRRLVDSRANIVGAVLTKFTGAGSRYGSEYYYGYESYKSADEPTVDVYAESDTDAPRPMSLKAGHEAEFEPQP